MCAGLLPAHICTRVIVPPESGPCYCPSAAQSSRRIFAPLTSARVQHILSQRARVRLLARPQINLRAKRPSAAARRAIVCHCNCDEFFLLRFVGRHAIDAQSEECPISLFARAKQCGIAIMSIHCVSFSHCQNWRAPKGTRRATFSAFCSCSRMRCTVKWWRI